MTYKQRKTFNDMFMNARVVKCQKKVKKKINGQVVKMYVHHSDIYISFSNVNCGFISAYERVGDLREK